MGLPKGNNDPSYYGSVITGLKRVQMASSSPPGYDSSQSPARGALLPLLVEFLKNPDMGGAGNMFIGWSENEWDYNPATSSPLPPAWNILVSPLHPKGYRSVLYTDYHVQPAFYACTATGLTPQFPCVDGKANAKGQYFVWKLDGNAW